MELVSSDPGQTPTYGDVLVVSKSYELMHHVSPFATGVLTNVSGSMVTSTNSRSVRFPLKLPGWLAFPFSVTSSSPASARNVLLQSLPSAEH